MIKFHIHSTLGCYPVGNLDADTTKEITAASKESAQGFGKWVMVVTHFGEVAKQADVVLEIKV